MATKIEFNSLTDLFCTEDFRRKVDVQVRIADSDDFDLVPRSFDRFSVEHLYIENPGRFFTSDDGQMLFKKNVDDSITLLLVFNDNEKVVIPDGVNIIGKYAFAENFVKSVIMPDSVTQISTCAFFGCECLTDIRLSNALQIIGNGAFMNSGVETIKLPESVRLIENYAFYGCRNLRIVQLTREGQKLSISKDAFTCCDQLIKPFHSTDETVEKKARGLFEVLKAFFFEHQKTEAAS